jgi:hypothetical protein
MGAAASLTSASPKNLQAFAVAKCEYERILARVEREKELEDYEKLPSLDDRLLSRRLIEVYNAALLEAELDITECKNPCVLAKRMSELSAEQRKEYMQKVVLAVIDKERATFKPKVVADYSKSFSGSAADTKAEKDAAALMKGEGGAKEEDADAEDAPDINPYLRRPRYTKASKGASNQELADCKILNAHDRHVIFELGTQLKFLGASGCYMYVHSASKEVASLRPKNYDEDEDVGGGVALANEQIAAEEGRTSKTTGGSGPGATAGSEDIPEDIRVCRLQDLPAVLDELINVQGVTPLILDTSEEQRVRAFMEYKHCLCDVSALAVPFAKSGLKRDDVMEGCRVRLVTALKTGAMFCLYMGQCGIEHADFKKKLCKKDKFPVDVFTNAGKKLFTIGPDGEPRFRLVYREADKQSGQIVAKEDTFRVCVVSSLHPRQWREQLCDCLPTGYMAPVYVSG